MSLCDGRRVNIATEPLADEPGQILLIIDVTETRRLQESLNHHRRLSAKTELAAALAHQIRTPLAAAMLHTSNLATRLGQSAPAAGRALESMRELERLVEDMLTYARGGQLDVDEFPLPSLLERLRAHVVANTPGSAFRLELDDDGADVTLVGNADALLSILLNLVNNARTATNGCGRVTVRSALHDDRVAITIEDDGPGIPAHEAERVFEPFHTTTAGGTGLGLAVARSIARAHHGELTLDPDHTGGARFVLKLPVPDATARDRRQPLTESPMAAAAVTSL